jgi:hypothetical protein
VSGGKIHPTPTPSQIEMLSGNLIIYDNVSPAPSWRPFTADELIRIIVSTWNCYTSSNGSFGFYDPHNLDDVSDRRNDI